MTSAPNTPGAPPAVTEFTSLVDRASAMASGAGRTLLGITGAPGAGKSTLAQAIVSQTGTAARLVGMDGFHLSQARLAELGRLDRKGAVDTFDGEGFLALLRRLRAGGEEVVYAPEFRRECEESIAGALAIEPEVRLVVVEGNYLLLPEQPWGELRELLDEVWYCERRESTRIADLISRHLVYGKSDAEARRWALGPDQRNAELIAATRAFADIVVTLDREPVAARDLAKPVEQ